MKISRLASTFIQPLDLVNPEEGHPVFGVTILSVHRRLAVPSLKLLLCSSFLVDKLPIVQVFKGRIDDILPV